MKQCFILFLLYLSLLSAEDELDYSLVNLTRTPIQKVAGNVNIITGNWVDQTTHHITSGPDPYVVGHSYISSSLEEGTLADGWDLYHPSELTVYQPQGIRYVRKSAEAPSFGLKTAACFGLNAATATVGIPRGMIAKGSHGKHHHRKDSPLKPDCPPRDCKAEGHPLHPEHNEATLVYRESGGATYVFKGDDDAKHFHPKIHKSGYNHISSIDAPAGRDIRRTTVAWDKNHDEWAVTLGDGTKRFYSRSNRFKRCPLTREQFPKAAYHIREEVLPSGNRRWYHYSSDNDLTRIQTVSSDGKYVLHYVEFHRRRDEVEVKTSEGITTRFSLKKLHDDETAHVVDSIHHPGRGRISFTYCDKSDHHLRRIYEKTVGNGRKDIVRFYHEGNNDVGDEKVSITHKKDKKFYEDRVREIWTKQYHGHSHVLSHAITYKGWDTHAKAKAKESDGAVTEYMWDTELRPTWISFEGPDGRRIRSEHFTWGEGDDEGRLLRRTHLDESSSPLLDHECEFDSDGDVVKEHFRGVFTSEADLRMDSDRKIHGGDTLTWKAEYTSDGRRLKKAEVDPLGNWTYYEYEDKRCLLTAKFICDKDRIIRREFYDYDAAANCIKSSSDDGSSRSRHNLRDVTRKTTKEVKPRYTTPNFGAPEEETWSIWTPTCGKQVTSVERYTRDRNGRATMKELVDAFGVVQKRWTYAYDKCHRVIESCDPSGCIEKFSYDDSGHLASKTTPDATTYYTYDLLDRVIEKKKVFPDGSSSSECTQYDLTGRVKTTVDARGRTTKEIYDLCGRKTKIIHPSIATEQGTLFPEETITYSGLTEHHKSPTGATSTVVRSASGKVLRIVSPHEAWACFNYDKKNRLITQWNSSGLTTHYEYDASGRPTKITQSSPDGKVSETTKSYLGFDLIEETFPTKKIHYFYDTLGRKIAQTVTDLVANQSTTTDFYYDTLHRLVHTVYKDLGTEEWLTYDAADRVIEKKLTGDDGVLLSLTTTCYDAAGRVIEEGTARNGAIAKTTTAYGALGLPSVITHPDGTQTRYSYNPLCQWQDGRVYFHKVQIDARGVITEELLDANDAPRMSIVRDPYANLISMRIAAFSILGKPVLIEDHIFASLQDRSIIKTRIAYDDVGQMISQTEADGTPEAATWRYTYDTEGRKIEEIKPSGATLTSSYDFRGRLETYRSSDGTIDWQYHYNVQDLPERIENKVSGKSTERQYNGLGSIIHERLETGLAIGYEVTPTGLLSSVILPDGSRSSYRYRNGRLHQVERNGLIYTVNARDQSGMITSATLPVAGGMLTQAIDIMGRRNQVTTSAFEERRTAFDAVGCCLERFIDNERETFSYDYLCHLTNDNGRTAAYDSIHRRIENEGMPVVHNAHNEVLVHGDKTYRYDVDGRRTGDDRYTYRYDACDRLISVEDGSSKYEYAYDPFNRRLSSTSTTNIDGAWKSIDKERFIWQSDCEIGSVDESNHLRTLRVLGEGLGAEIGASVLFELSGASYVPIHDLSGNVRAVADRNGQVVEKLSYTAFGLQSRTSNLTPWTFSSKRQDQGTGFLYFGRRYYDPVTANWLTRDPKGLSAGPNLYAYVNNNPLTCSDLYGLLEEILSEMREIEYSRNGVHHTYVVSGGTICLKEDLGKENVPRLDLSRHTWSQVITEYNGKQFGTFAHINGIKTTFQEAKQRQTHICDKYPGVYDDAITLYNPTHGFLMDILETIAIMLGLKTEVSEIQKEEIEVACDLCKEANVGFKTDLTGHSEGGAIEVDIRTSEEFKNKEDYGNFLGHTATFGGASLDPDGENYVVEGDFVPYLNPANWNTLGSDRVHYIERGDQSIFESHFYDSPGYQRAVDNFIEHREAR